MNKRTKKLTEDILQKLREKGVLREEQGLFYVLKQGPVGKVADDH